MNELEKEIDAYLSGDMTPAAQQAFEERLQSDPQLQKEVNTSQKMNAFYNEKDWHTAENETRSQDVNAYEEFLKSAQGKDLAASIQHAGNSYFEQKSTPVIKKWIPYASAIAAILVIGFFIIFQISRPTDPADLYADYKNWETLPSLTVRNETNALSDAENQFKKGDYQEALQAFTDYQKAHTKELNPQLLLYVGVTQLELNQHKKAEETFTKLLESNTLDAFMANWYLALTYLKTKDSKKATQYLSKIAEHPKNPFYEEAKKLLSELE